MSLEALWRSIKDFVTDNSTEKRVFLGVLAIAGGWTLYKVHTIRKFNNQRKKHIETRSQNNTELEVSSSESGKPRQLVNLFVQRMSQDPVLAKFFHPRMFQPHSLYACILEKYMTAALEGKEPDLPIDMRTVHKGIKIKKEHFDRWVELWKRCQDQVGLHTRNDLWRDMELKIVSQR